MIVTTADVIPGQAVQVLGLVRGNIVTSKNIGRDLMAGMKSIVGGEIVSYTQMTDEARQVAEDRMVTAAQNLGADAVVAMRFASDVLISELSTCGSIMILALGLNMIDLTKFKVLNYLPALIVVPFALWAFQVAGLA